MTFARLIPDDEDDCLRRQERAARQPQAWDEIEGIKCPRCHDRLADASEAEGCDEARCPMKDGGGE